MFESIELRHLLANILVVSDPASASAQPDETDLFNFLTAAGHTVDADSGTLTAGVPTATQLADVDLILVSRTTTSGNYTQGTEPQDWNGLDIPLLLMAPHIARSSHWGWFDSTSLPGDQTAPTNYNAFPNGSHAFVSGQTTAYAVAGVQIDSLNSTAVPPGATTVATITVGGNVHAAIVDIPVGAMAFNGRGSFGARRVFFTMPDYPDKANQDFPDVLSPNAQQIVLNIIDDLVAPTFLEAENATLSGPTIETLHTGFMGTGSLSSSNSTCCS